MFGFLTKWSSSGGAAAADSSHGNRAHRGGRCQSPRLERYTGLILTHYNSSFDVWVQPDRRKDRIFSIKFSVLVKYQSDAASPSFLTDPTAGSGTGHSEPLSQKC